jgi:hypothetical protein
LATASHPWLGQLHSGLDNLAAALLRGDAQATEQASAEVHAIFQRAPQAHELADAGQTLYTELLQTAQRFAALHQAVLRNAAQSQRAVHSLLPHTTPITYSRQIGPAPSSTGGAGHGFLSA